ncbi:MFS transporter [Saccharopolyspora elongata]|uniref:MFS transporter n=1 Tax=Saccharopolyspora elongata TaxID=2530387 RepID=UPI001F2A7AB6|nr:MFS transporter [Saccharopolyspora elongata]
MTSDISNPRRADIRAWSVLGCLATLQFLIAIDVTVVNVALPSIGAGLSVSARELTWVVVAYTITGGGLLMLGGRLGDVLGRRRVLIAGTALFGAASLLAGLAPSFPLLVVARLLQGVGEALALPASMATIVLMFPEGPRRSRALSVWAAVASTGLVVGFVLSGIITELYGWRWIFLVSVPFVVLVIIGAIALVPADSAVARVPLDLPGSLLLTLTPLLFAFGVIEAGEGGTAPWITAVVLIASAVSGALFVVVEKRSAAPLIPLTFFRNKTRVMANLSTALLSAALSTSFMLFTLHLQQRALLTPLEAGLMLLPLAMSLVAAATFVPRLLERWGARACAGAGIALTAAGMAAIAIPSSGGAGAAATIPAMVLIAAGMGFGLVGLQYAAVTGVTEDDAGVASGIQRAADQLGGSTGIALYIGIAFAPTLATSIDPFVTASALAVAGLAAAWLITRRITMPEPEKEPEVG